LLFPKIEILRMAYFRDDEVTKQFCSNLFSWSSHRCGILAILACTAAPMFCSVIALFRYAVAYYMYVVSIFVDRASYKYRPIDSTEIMILTTSAQSFGMHSILRSSVRRITCSSKLMSGGGSGGGVMVSSPIKFQLPAAAAVVSSAQSIPPASFSQASFFSTAPDLNDGNQKW